MPPGQQKTLTQPLFLERRDDMVRLKWDEPGSREYETGISKGVLYSSEGAVAWNGLTSIDEEFEGGNVNELYFDGLKYLNE